MKVSILIPAYNERKTLPEVLGRLSQLKGLDLEVVIADDASTDGTPEWLGAQLPDIGWPVKIVRHEVNRGKGAAVVSAFRASSGEIVVIQDADLEYDPSYIERLVAEIASGSAEVVYGSRLLTKGSVTHSRLYLCGNMFLTWIINRLCGSSMTDAYTGYKAFSRAVMASLGIESSGFEIEAEVSVKVAMRGFAYREVPIIYRARTRAAGKKIGWRDAVLGIWTILRTWWSERRGRR